MELVANDVMGVHNAIRSAARKARINFSSRVVRSISRKRSATSNQHDETDDGFHSPSLRSLDIVFSIDCGNIVTRLCSAPLSLDITLNKI